jgi:4-carboxymuconolactone decarboxylase
VAAALSPLAQTARAQWAPRLRPLNGKQTQYVPKPCRHSRGAASQSLRKTQNYSTVSPALQRYETEVLSERVWARPALSRRDRSIVTLAALITRGQTGQLPLYAGHALDHGVTPKELSEVITHLAFYAGWESPLPQQP